MQEIKLSVKISTSSPREDLNNIIESATRAAKVVIEGSLHHTEKEGNKEIINIEYNERTEEGKQEIVIGYRKGIKQTRKRKRTETKQEEDAIPNELFNKEFLIYEQPNDRRHSGPNQTT